MDSKVLGLLEQKEMTAILKAIFVMLCLSESIMNQQMQAGSRCVRFQYICNWKFIGFIFPAWLSLQVKKLNDADCDII